MPVSLALVQLCSSVSLLLSCGSCPTEPRAQALRGHFLLCEPHALIPGTFYNGQESALLGKAAGMNSQGTSSREITLLPSL